MQIIQRGPLSAHSRYRNAAPFSTCSFREQRSPGKCYLLSGTNSFRSGDVTSPLIPRTHEDSEAGGGSEPGLPVSRWCSSANSGEHPWNQVQAVHLSQASPVLNTGWEMGFSWPDRACQCFSSLFNNQLPSRDLRNVVFVPLKCAAGCHLLLAATESLETQGNRANIEHLKLSKTASLHNVWC